MAWYFPKLYSSFELDLSNSTKIWCKKSSKCWYIIIIKKVELASMKSDIDKLKKVPTSLNNLKPDVDKIDLNKVKTTPREWYCQKDLFYRLNSKLFGLGN